MNLFNCYSSQGNFSSKLAYITYFEKIPNVYDISLDSKSQINCVDLDVIKLIEILSLKENQYTINTSTTFSTFKTSMVQESEEDDEVYRFGEWNATGIFITDFDKQFLWNITRTGVTLLYSTLDINGETKKLFNEVLSKLPRKVENNNASEVQLIAYENGYYTINSKIENVNIDIEENYNDDFLPVHEDIKNFLNSRSSGIVIARGNVGTGKTSYIRHLCATIPKRYCIVTNTIAQRMADPEFISFMMNCKDSVFILEDCEQILMDRYKNSFSGAISNILNMSDGLMSDVFNVKFICTFNADIEKIDSALLRKGRCYADYEFKPLNKEKTKHLLEKQGISIPDFELKEMTLAEIYNYNKTNYGNTKPENKIGF